jgi:hypothetical protein
MQVKNVYRIGVFMWVCYVTSASDEISKNTMTLALSLRSSSLTHMHTAPQSRWHIIWHLHAPNFVQDFLSSTQHTTSLTIRTINAQRTPKSPLQLRNDRTS